MSLALAAGVVAFGVLVGAVSALFGVGGGLLMVPFMVLVLGESQHLAEGTSLLVIIPTALTGAIAHTRRGYVSFRHSGLVALGGVAGAYAGASLALTIPERPLRVIFTVLLLVVAAHLIWQGVAQRGARRSG